MMSNLRGTRRYFAARPIRAGMCIVVFLQCVTVGLSDDKLDSQSNSFQRLPVSELQELPGVVRVNLGELRARDEYYYELPILNGSGEAVQLAEAKASCKCVLGFIRDAVLAPGQQTILKLKVTPGVDPEFKRTLALLGPKGSGKSIAIQIEATVKDWVSFVPRSIEFTEERKITNVNLTANFGLEFGDVAVETSRFLDWKLVSRNATTAVFEVTSRRSSDDWGAAGTQQETLVLRPAVDAKSIQLSFPFTSVGRPVIRPKSMQIREDLAVKFFLLGGLSLLQSDEGDIDLVIMNGEGQPTGEITVQIQSSRLATCIVTFSRKEASGFKEEEEFVIRNQRTRDIVGRIKIGFDSMLKKRD